MVLLGHEYRAIVEQVRVGVVSVDKEDSGNVSATRPTLDLNDDIERIGDVGLDRPIRELDPTLQHTTCEAREALLRGVCVDTVSGQDAASIKRWMRSTRDC